MISNALDQFDPLVNLRIYQNACFRVKLRVLFALWRRQSGKSHTIAAKCMERMLKIRNHSCFAVSGSILMGRELIEKEATIWYKFLVDLKEAEEKLKVHLGGNVIDMGNGQVLKIDDLAQLIEDSIQFEKKAAQIRIYHTRTSFSRTMIIAPNPATARGWTGDIYADEIGFWHDFKQVWDAIEPFISSNPALVFWLFTTPPEDDTHFTFDFLNPGNLEFTPKAEGNFFKTETGYPVHRLDAYDTEEAGIHLYSPDTGDVISIEEARARALDRASFDRNYLLKFVQGGSAAIPLHLLQRAALLGRDGCTGHDLAGEEVAA